MLAPRASLAPLWDCARPSRLLRAAGGPPPLFCSDALARLASERPRDEHSRRLCPAGGDLGGCSALRSSVEAAEAKPRLWLCGHIHEGRGAARVRFGERLRSARPPSSGGGAAPLPAAEATLRERRGAEGGAGAAAPESTVVVNAASANSGMAKRLLHGATVVTLLT